VNERQNPRYFRLIREFEKAAQVPMVLNTSFNDSEPIVCTPQDAIHCFQNSRIDVLVLGNRLVRRT
jgi:carbamoyltransferase